jgi:hypothetical protein
MRLEIWLLSMILCLPFSVLVGWMAKSYQRSSGAWFLLAVIFTPLVAFVFLLVAGVPHSAVVRKEKEERVRKQHPDRGDVSDIARSELDCPQCGATVNPATGDGLHSPESEPWRLICDKCEAEVVP